MILSNYNFNYYSDEEAFLRENKDNWNLENDKIMFSSETLYNNYEGLLTGISDDKVNNM